MTAPTVPTVSTAVDEPVAAAVDEAVAAAFAEPVDGAGQPEVRVLGIRHHGPGSARAVLRELADLQPELVLIEGPADANPMLFHAGSADMVPPVALLAYDTAHPRRAAFWPFAVFSPEWQALSWAAANGAQVRMCDLPATVVLGRQAAEDAQAEGDDGEATVDAGSPDGQQPAEGSEPGQSAPEQSGPDDTGAAAPQTAADVRADPIAVLAAAAGYDDPERWWEDVLESRPGTGSPFQAIAEAMGELRSRGVGAASSPARQLVEDQREAQMRQVLRSAQAGDARRIAVVCGAWHVPALTAPLPSAASDARLLRGLPKVKSALSWVPWTHSRLAAASGYGAGVPSPGWYHHLFTVTEQPLERWLVAVADRLRTEDLPVSSAHVIEAVRLATTLAALRGRPLAGLSEVTEAALSVICEGNELTLELVHRDLVVGEALGSLPPEVPLVPLESDLRAQAKRLRLPITPAAKTIALDLRQDLDVRRSRLLHRLAALDIDWGTATADAVRNSGTFRESWTLCWRPELAIDVVEASLWGTTVEAAAAARLIADAQSAARLSDVTAALRTTLLADLPPAVADILTVLQQRAAVDLDVLHLMQALPALIESARYPDVRGSDVAAISAVADEVLLRVCINLPGAVGALDTDGATAMKAATDAVHAAVLLRADDAAGIDGRDRWMATLADLAGRHDLHGLLAGRVTRLLFDAGVWNSAETAGRLGRALSSGAVAADKADWVEGFASGGGLLLIHDEKLLSLLDDWLGALASDDFVNLLPLLRRTFGSFPTGERRQIGDKVARLGGVAADRESEIDLDEELAGPAMATVLALLGYSGPGSSA